MSLLSYFNARLSCPHCGEVCEVNIQNKLLDEWDNNTLRVGDHRDDLTIGDFELAYLTVRLPEADEAIHVLEAWSCPKCRHGNWAEIVFCDGTLESIEAVELSRASLSRAHFITQWVEEDYERLRGTSMWTPDGVRPNFVEELKAHVPTS